MNPLTLRAQQLAQADGWPEFLAAPAPAPDVVAHHLQAYPDYRDVADALRGADKAKPVSVASARAFMEALEGFTHTYAHVLTYPASWQGWAEAVRLVAQAAPFSPVAQQQWAAVFAYQPAAVLRAIHPPRAVVEPEAPVVPVSLAGVTSEPAAPSVSRPSRQVPTPSPIDSDAEALVEDLIKTMDGSAGWESRWDARLQKAKQRENWDAWWCDQVFPVLCQQDPAALERLADHWPDVHRVKVADPGRWVTRRAFWNSLRGGTAELRQVVHEKLLPQLVAGHYWSIRESQETLVGLLRFTEKNTALFEQRLALWTAWGGQLDHAMEANMPGQDDEQAPAGWGPLDPVTVREYLTSREDAPAWQAAKKPGRRPSP